MNITIETIKPKVTGSYQGDGVGELTLYDASTVTYDQIDVIYDGMIGISSGRVAMKSVDGVKPNVNITNI